MSLFAGMGDGDGKPRPMQARMESDCDVCDMSIAVGDLIVRDPSSSRYIHDRCWKHRRR